MRKKVFNYPKTISHVVWSGYVATSTQKAWWKSQGMGVYFHERWTKSGQFFGDRLPLDKPTSMKIKPVDKDVFDKAKGYFIVSMQITFKKAILNFAWDIYSILIYNPKRKNRNEQITTHKDEYTHASYWQLVVSKSLLDPFFFWFQLIKGYRFVRKKQTKEHCF